MLKIAIAMSMEGHEWQINKTLIKSNRWCEYSCLWRKSDCDKSCKLGKVIYIPVHEEKENEKEILLWSIRPCVWLVEKKGEKKVKINWNIWVIFKETFCDYLSKDIVHHKIVTFHPYYVYIKTWCVLIYDKLIYLKLLQNKLDWIKMANYCPN